MQIGSFEWHTYKNHIDLTVSMNPCIQRRFMRVLCCQLKPAWQRAPCLVGLQSEVTSALEVALSKGLYVNTHSNE